MCVYLSYTTCFAQGSRANELSRHGCFTNQHNLYFGISWILYQKMQILNQTGVLRISTAPGHSYKFELAYTYFHNNYFGLSAGLGFGKVKYVYGAYASLNQNNLLLLPSDVNLHSSASDLFFYFPLFARFNIPTKSKFSVYTDMGFNLTIHPRSFIEEFFYVEDGNTLKNVSYTIIYRNGFGEKVFPDLVFAIGGMIKLPYNDFLSIKAICNISPKNIVDGKGSYFNLGQGNDTYVEYEMNTSYIGLEFAYILSRFLQTNKRVKKFTP